MNAHIPGREIIDHIYSVKDVQWPNFNVVRAGVIPYTIVNNQVFLCLGVDRRTQELTDFGGGVKPSDPSPVVGGLREWREESKGVFGEANYDEARVKDSYCLLKPFQQRGRPELHYMLIIFQELPSSHLTEAVTLFGERQASDRDEVSALLWVTEHMFKQLVYAPGLTRLYSKVKKFIANSISFNRLLYHLKISHQSSSPEPIKPVRNTFKRKCYVIKRPQFNFSKYTIGAEG